MAIKVGDKLPDGTFKVMGGEGPEDKSVGDVFAGKKVALFAVPGAYTPTCHKQHMPGFVARFDELTSKGIDTVACVSVNDIFVLDHWSSEVNPGGRIMILADGSAGFTKAIGLDIDLGPFGLGIRSKRYAMLVDDGVVKALNVEDAPPQHDKSSAETLCSLIDRSPLI
jgi:peroxiredoxin